MSAQHISQLPDDLLELILHGSGRLDDAADRAAARLVCRTWQYIIDRGMHCCIQPASVPSTGVAAAFSSVRKLDLCRLHRKSDEEVAAQLQQLPLVMPALTALHLGGLWLRDHAGLRAVAQLPQLAWLSLAGCRSDSVLQQLSSLTSLACTLTFLDLSHLHQWEGRPTIDRLLELPVAMTRLTRLQTLIFSTGITPDTAVLTPLAESLQHLRLCDLRPRATPLTVFLGLTNLTALSITVGQTAQRFEDLVAVGCLSRLRRLALCNNIQYHTHGVHPLTDAGLAAMLKPLVRLTALAVDGWTAASVAQNLSCVTHLSELRSLAIQSDFVQALMLPKGLQLLQLTRLDLSHLGMQTGRRAAMEQICQLSAMQCLQLGFGNIPTDSGCQMMRTSLTRLRQLGIAASQVIGLDGLQHLAGLPALEQLDMSGIMNCLPKGCRMPQLTALDISGAQVAREGATPADCCPNLRELRVGAGRGGSCRIDAHNLAAMLAGLSRLSQLSALHMENMHMLGAHACSALLAKIAAAPELRLLNLNGSVSESGWLVPVHSMKTLRVLRCRGTYHVNTALFAAHPYLRVFDSEYDTWQQQPLLSEDSDDC